MTFEEALIARVRQLRERFQQNESQSQFFLEITVSGRLHDGELMLEYRTGADYSDSVVSTSIEASSREFTRRKGWEGQNQPKMISFSAPKVDDEIPY